MNTVTETTAPSNTKRIIRLKTQKQRATFVRREIRLQGWNVNQLADEAELAWMTVHNFAQEITRLPRMETVVRIFGVLGYDVVFTARKSSKGSIEV